jgi:hypothetical protein
LVKLAALAAVVALAGGCVTLKPEMLDASDDALQTRILPLYVGLAGPNVVRGEQAKHLPTQSEMLTVAERELQENAFRADQRLWGYVDLKATFDERNLTAGGAALFAVNMITATVPAIFGSPLSIQRRTLQVEVGIYDSRKAPVRRYVYTEAVKYAVFLYSRWDAAYRKAGINAMKEILARLKEDLGRDAPEINRDLESVGPISLP